MNESNNEPRVQRVGSRIAIPGFATAHSHAFQRALRGLTHRRLGAEASFWSWRQQMYDLVDRLDPETMQKIARYAFMELAVAGYTAVGEFHYVHHDRDGTPYKDRVVMADAVIEAAREVGIRISLLRVLYHRGGYRQPAAGSQLRFCDPDVDRCFYDVEKLIDRWRDDPYVHIGIAPHSVRAVPEEWLRDAAAFAAKKNVPLHMHVSEQVREVEECIEEHGVRPVELLERNDVLGPNFCAVHATHLLTHETKALGRGFVCVCRSTERDLGDGSPDVTALRDAGARICMGVDSHAIVDPFEEMRAIELDERVRTGTRCAAYGPHELLDVATRQGYAAIGMADAWEEDEVELEPADIAMVGIPESHLLDGVVFAGSLRAIRAVTVRNTTVGRGGSTHAFGREFTADYREVLKTI